MKTLKEQIEDNVAQEISNGRFRGSYRVVQIKGKPHMSGEIELPRLDRIKIGYNPEYDKISPGMLPIIARDVTRHEINHRRYGDFNGCPRTVRYHAENILEPIALVLKPKGLGDSDFCYLANTLEDTILHSDLSREFKLDGIAEFFSDVGRSAPEGKFTTFYDAHVKLNLALWGNGKQKKKLREYFVRDPAKQKQISKVIHQFLERTGISSLEQEIDVRGKTTKVKDLKKIRDFLNNPDNWALVAKVYAEEFSAIIEPSYAQPIPNHSGAGTKGREKESPLESDGNEFDKEMRSPDYKIKRVQEAYNSDTGVPPTMTSFEAKDLLYQALARRLNFNVRTFTQSEQRPVTWYGQRDFDPEKDRPVHLTFGLNEKGSPMLKKRTHSVNMNVPHKQMPQGFPETRFGLLDTSGSMKLNSKNECNYGTPLNVGKTSLIPWGDQSKYHFGLLAWYGFLEYLKQNHLLNPHTVGLGNFSTQTVISHGLEESKKNALSPQFGGTNIDNTKLEDIFRGEGSLVFTISDGEVGNWDAIKSDFIEKAHKHQYVHFQIGGNSGMADDLKKEGFTVVPIEKAEDLAQKVIDITDNAYRGQSR